MNGLLAILPTAVLVAACTGGTGSASMTATPVLTGVAATAAPSTAAATASAEPSESAVPSAAPAATFLPFTLKGKGKKIARFVKPPTAAIAVITHAGKHNFIVDAIDPSGEEIDHLVNEIGKYEGTVLFDEEDGDMSVAFKIDADGAWTIVVKPVTEARVWDPATTLKGVGDDVVLVYPIPRGLVTLDLVFKGKHNFIVDALSPDGVENLVNEIGDFSGQVLLPDGTRLLVVTGHAGTWTATTG